MSNRKLNSRRISFFSNSVEGGSSMSDNLADILDDAMYISRREVFYSLINTNYFQVLIFYIF
jgi:hypothetical protein